MNIYIENLKERYEDAVRNEPIVALAEGFAHRGEMTKIDSLKMAVVELIGVKENLLKQVLYGPPPVVIFRTEPPVSAEQEWNQMKISSDKEKYKGTGEYRPPKKGEFYFSTVQLKVVEASFDFESEQHIYTLKEPHAQRKNK